MKIYDITATIGGNLPFYGTEGPAAIKAAQIKNGDKYNFTNLKLTTHTGTHADMPSHFILDGATCDTIPLDYFYGKATLIRITPTAHITKEDLLPLNIPTGGILLLDTSQSKFMSQGTLKTDFISLTPSAAEYLLEKKIKTLGIDYLSVDPYDDIDFPVHTALLGGGVVILEGLVLEGVPEGEYILSALPLKLEDGDGSPVRAILIEMN